MNYYYYLSYDANKNEFFSMVDEGEKNTVPIFTIDSTEEILEYIKTGVMLHIDDVNGLEAFLKRQDILKPEDSLSISEKPLW